MTEPIQEKTINKTEFSTHARSVILSGGLGVCRNAKGRGVIATKDFNKEDIVEVCPVIIYDDKNQLVPDDHSYEWDNGRWCFVLGYGSLYNHSYAPNVDYHREYKNETIVYEAITPIKKGDELLINYNGFPEKTEPVDFVVL